MGLITTFAIGENGPASLYENRVRSNITKRGRGRRTEASVKAISRPIPIRCTGQSGIQRGENDGGDDGRAEENGGSR